MKKNLKRGSMNLTCRSHGAIDSSGKLEGHDQQAKKGRWQKAWLRKRNAQGKVTLLSVKLANLIN